MATTRSKTKLAACKQGTRSRQHRTLKPARTTAALAQNKKAKIIALLNRPSVTTIAAMMKASGWQRDSMRGFLAGVVRKKLKLSLVSEREDNDDRVYRIDQKVRRAKSEIAAAKSA